MRTFFECIPCFVRQTVEAVKMVTDDTAIQEQVIREVLRGAADMNLMKTPPHMAQRIHRVIKKTTGISDPYADIKRRSNTFAAHIYPELMSIVDRSDRPFETAVRLAIAGNIIDFGVHSAKPEFDEAVVHDSINDALEAPIDEAAVDRLHTESSHAERILYLADNAGELCFDRLLIEQLPTERVTLAVKGAAIINDATMEDAQACRLTSLVNVIENGSDAPGTILEDCSDGFRKLFATSSLVISKGQGNYETLSGAGGNVYFLLKAKCPVIARHLGVSIGSIVITKNPESPAT
jgi:uncharacterized protein with ATP-grasp and redox domains